MSAAKLCQIWQSEKSSESNGDQYQKSLVNGVSIALRQRRISRVFKQSLAEMVSTAQGYREILLTEAIFCIIVCIVPTAQDFSIVDFTIVQSTLALKTSHIVTRAATFFYSTLFIRINLFSKLPCRQYEGLTIYQLYKMPRHRKTRSSDFASDENANISVSPKSRAKRHSLPAFSKRLSSTPKNALMRRSALQRECIKSPKRD